MARSVGANAVPARLVLSCEFFSLVLEAGSDIIAGLGPGVDLRLDEVFSGSYVRTISRRQFRIIHSANDGFAISDLSSLNGTSVNGILLPSGRWWPLASGDRIKVAGSEEFVLDVTIDEPEEGYLPPTGSTGVPRLSNTANAPNTLFMAGSQFILDGISILPSHLTTLEQKLLEYLFVNAARVCSYDELIRCVWGYAQYEKIQNNTVAALISSLRHKLDVVSPGAGHRHIRTIRGRGVLLMPL